MVRGQNLAFAFVYNALGIPLTAGLLYPFIGQLLLPMIAALAMSLSSVSVITNALRLRRFPEMKIPLCAVLAGALQGAAEACPSLVWLATRRSGEEYPLASGYRFAGGSHAIRNPCFTALHCIPPALRKVAFSFPKTA